MKEEGLSPKDSKEAQALIQFNQYIQLVNKNNEFPDAGALNSYDEKTKRWILERTEFEQTERLKLANKLADYDHQLGITHATEAGRTQRHSQSMGSGTLIIIFGMISFLLYTGHPIEGLSLLLVPLGVGIASVLGNKSKKS